MRCITAKQSTMVSGGNIGPIVTGAIVMAFLPFVSLSQTSYKYADTGLACGALVSNYYVTKSMSPEAAFGTRVLGAFIGLVAGVMQGYAAELYHDYRSSVALTNQTAV